MNSALSGILGDRDRVRTGLLLAVLCLAVYLPGFFTIPAVDRDESRFAQASRQMAESGDFIVPRIQGKPRLNKPPLIYWLQSASALALTTRDIKQDSIWMYRIPSLFAAIGTVLITWRLGRRMFGANIAKVAAATLAVCPVYYWEARQARADMVMVFFTTLAMYGAWNVISPGSPRAPTGRAAPSADRPADSPSPAPPTTSALLTLWLATAAGILTKGPITPMVVICTVLFVALITRRWSILIRCAPVLGLVVILALCLPWLFAVQHRIGADQYWKTIFDETVGRSTAAKEGHAGFPGIHLLLTPALFFPGSLGLGVGLWGAWLQLRRAWMARRALVAPPHLRPEIFLIGWLVPMWLFFECISTRLVHYTMPLYPALALLCAKGLLTNAPWAKRWFAQTTWVTIGARVWIGACGFGSAVMWGIGAAAWGSGNDWVSLCTGGLVAFIGIIITVILVRVLVKLWRTRQIGRLIFASVFGFGLGGMVLGACAPSINAIWITRGLMTVLHQVDPHATRPIAAVGYQEDSLIFETRGRAQRLDFSRDKDGQILIDQLTPWLKANPDGLVCIDEDSAQSFPQLLVQDTIRGFNYSRGRWVEVTVGALKKEKHP